MFHAIIPIRLAADREWMKPLDRSTVEHRFWILVL
jgi:hypothetical protein